MAGAWFFQLLCYQMLARTQAGLITTSWLHQCSGVILKHMPEQPTPPKENARRRWSRPQFSLLMVLVIMSGAAIVLAINFAPPKITYEPGELKGDVVLRAQRGWPLRHLDYWTEEVSDRIDAARDATAWPTTLPRPPVTSNWKKLTANVILFLAIVTALWWIVVWSINMLRAASRPVQANQIKAWRPTAMLCIVGGMAIAWGSTVIICESIDVVDVLLSQWSFAGIGDARTLKLLLPPLFIANGFLALAVARRWLQCDARSFKMTAIVLLVISVLVVIDVTGRDLLNPLVDQVFPRP